MIRRLSQGNIPKDEADYKTFSEIMCTRNHLITQRDFSLDPAIGEDFITLLERSLIFARKVNFTLEELIEDMLNALSQDSKVKKDPYFANYEQYDKYDDRNENADPIQFDELQLDEGAAFPMDEDDLAMTTQEFSLELAMGQIFVSETVSGLTHFIQRARFNEFQGVFHDDSWVIVLCELQSIKHRKAIICRMAAEMYIMPTCQAARCVILVLANSDERGLKNVLHTGANFATVLSHPNFMKKFVDIDQADEIFNLFLTIVDDLSAEEVGKDGQITKEEKEAMALHFGKPFTGIKEDVCMRFPYYLDDFADGILGYKTKQKLLSATTFQYFATILPCMALGNAMDVNTNKELSVKNVVYSQFLGSILYGLFSANPMMMFQVSSVVLLYCQMIYVLASSQQYDFRLLFSTTVFFSGLFLIVASIFNLNKLMIFNTASVADMLDVFQSITYVQNVIMDTVMDYSPEKCRDFSQGCSQGAHVLKIFIVFLTIVISFNIRSIRGTRFFSANAREFLSDMGLPLGVIGSTAVAIFAFSDIKLQPFHYNPCLSPFSWINFSKVDFGMLTYSFFLAMPLSMLIFLDHNMNIEFLMDPNNKLVKGCATHFDIFIIGVINAFLGLLGMCPLQGMFPNTPLHIRQMADIEVTVEQDVQVKTLVKVRDTRLTQLLVGMMIGLSTFLLPLPLGFVPNAALDGLLLVIGYVSLDGNGLFDRLTLFFMDQTAFPSNHPIRKVPVSVAHNFTLAQIVQLTVIMVVSFSQNNVLTILFPVFLAMLLPVRILLIPKIFSSKHLELLDPTKFN